VPNFEEAYNQLNQEQKKAVDTIDGAVLTIAGPGTGKTQILALRVANILRKTDTLPNNIMCLTFTDAASNNLRKRLIGFLGKDGYKVRIHTFHGLATSIMQDYPEDFFDAADFKACDDITQVEILDNILENLDLLDPLRKKHPEQGWIYRSELINRIKDLKKNNINPTDFNKILVANKKEIEEIEVTIIPFLDKTINKKSLVELEEVVLELSKIESNLDKDLSHLKIVNLAKTYVKKLSIILQQAQIDEKKAKSLLSSFKKESTKKNSFNQRILKEFSNQEKYQSLATVYERYQEELYKRCLFDFEDMIVQVLNALRSNLELRYTIQENIHYLLIDEFQDTNLAQLELSENLLNLELNEGNPNIFVVGDDDQSIYKFQGANLDNILDFKNRYPKTKEIFLVKNYRSKQFILDFSQDIIEQSEVRIGKFLGIEKELIAVRE
jgi:DNA helicase-2/ATP-dependent DNA helicase PcrA